MISAKVTGSFKHIEAFGKRIQRQEHTKSLEKYGPIGVQALARATPKETGETADSWYYEIVRRNGYFAIHWLNRHSENSVNIAAIVQYGHATRNGSWVEGIDYINPVIVPLFNQIADDMWRVVTK